MTPDERIEALLNRAGQTISDLPNPSSATYAYPKTQRRRIYDVAATWHGRSRHDLYEKVRIIGSIRRICLSFANTNWICNTT